MADELGEQTLHDELPRLYELVIRERVDSALAEAERRARAGDEEGTLIWALEQEAGRDQTGEAWQSPRGGLYAALLLRPDFNTKHWPEMVPLAVLSAGAAIAELAQPMTPLAYRWPNDLLIAPDLVGTVLYRAMPETGALIVSWQINVVPAQEESVWAYVNLEGGAETTPGELLGRTTRYFLDWINRWAEEGFAPARQAWQRRSLLEHPPAGGTALPIALDDEGALTVRDGKGERRLRLADALADRAG